MKVFGLFGSNRPKHVHDWKPVSARTTKNRRAVDPGAFFQTVITFVCVACKDSKTKTRRGAFKLRDLYPDA